MSNVGRDEFLRLDRPVFVCGAPRSGKSLLAKIISASSEFCVIREPKELWRIANDPGHDCWTKGDLGPNDADEIHRRCLRRLRQESGKRYVDDLVQHSLRLFFVLMVMPDAKIIRVIRDPGEIIPELISYWKGRNAAYALFDRKNLGIPPRALPEYVKRFMVNSFSKWRYGRQAQVGPRLPEIQAMPMSVSAEVVAANHLSRMLERAEHGIAEISTESWIEVRYEELCGEPEAVLSRVSEFCELGEVDNVLRFAREYIDPKYQSRHWISLSDEQRNLIAPEIEYWRKRLGYR